MNNKPYSFLQCLEVVRPDDQYDLEIYGQYYKLPKSGLSPLVESGNTSYRYDFGTKEVVLISDEGNEVIRKKIDPKSFAKAEYKWIKLTKEEARIKLGVDEY